MKGERGTEQYVLGIVCGREAAKDRRLFDVIYY